MAKSKKEEKPANPAPIGDTREFIGFMGSVMRGILNDTVSPEKAKAIVGAGNTILRGLELNMNWTKEMAKPATENMPYLLPDGSKEIKEEDL